MKIIKPLVTVVIPGRNSGRFLDSCITHIKKQTYQPIEIIVVDSNSKDNTSEVCKIHKVRLMNFDNRHLKGKFDATYKRNMGASAGKGKYIYYVDADFELSKGLIREAVDACENEGFDGVIVQEKMYGPGFWTSVKALEQDLIAGDDNVEAPRFYRKEVWDSLNGLDSDLGAGCDDWDMYQRFLEEGYKVKRIKSTLKHNEGRITLNGSFRKAMMYGQDVEKFVRKSPRKGFTYFFPIRMSYLRHWKLLLLHPFLTAGIVIIRTIEYTGGFFGLVKNALYSKRYA
jgi:glycosyltransferase involved in cell wall biosynthesis